MLEIGLKYDLRAPSLGTDPADLYEAAVDQAAWADENGLNFVRLMEHHGSDDGYCPSPLVLAAAMASRTATLAIRIEALILPFHDPVRIAEDAAVVDLLSRGRLELTIAAGYVPAEFAMFGRDRRDRAKLVEDGVRVLRQAWSGDSFEHDGRPIKVRPRPFRDGGPPIYLGGSSSASAKRAAHLADGFFPTSRHLVEVYLEECARIGTSPGRLPRRRPTRHTLFVAENPERMWGVLTPHLMHEMNAYAAWLKAGGVEAAYTTVQSEEELRGSGVYSIVTPQECLAICRELGPDGLFEMHPLVGGLAPEHGWRCLELFAEQVLPQLRSEGLVAPQPSQ